MRRISGLRRHVSLARQIHMALYTHPDLSHSATEINNEAHITVDKMSQCWS